MSLLFKQADGAVVRRRRGLTVAVQVGLFCAAIGLSAVAAEPDREPWVSRAPAFYRSGPIDAAIVETPDPDADCRWFLHAPNHPGRLLGCFIPGYRLIFVPLRDAQDLPPEWPWARILDEEEAHARGWRHPEHP